MNFFTGVKAQIFWKFSIATGFTWGGYHNGLLSIPWRMPTAKFAFMNFAINLNQIDPSWASSRLNTTTSKIRTNSK